MLNTAFFLKSASRSNFFCLSNVCLSIDQYEKNNALHTS